MAGFKEANRGWHFNSMVVLYCHLYDSTQLVIGQFNPQLS